MPLTRGLFVTFCTASLLSAQTTRKQLTARELFYAAAQAPAANPAKPPSKATSRPTSTPPKRVEVARADPQPTPARPHDNTPAPKPPAQTAVMPASGEPPLGIRYTILKINADKSTTEVAADTRFHSGDRIRFSIEPNASGYLYIINQGSSGTWKPMFPSPEIDDGNNRVEGFHPYTMPPQSRLAFDTTAGTENLFIVFSRRPEPDLEQMIYSLQGKRPANPETKPEEGTVRTGKSMILAVNIANSAVDRLRNAYTRDLIVERVDPGTPGDRKETAVYVVNPSGSSDARVVADLHLVHE